MPNWVYNSVGITGPAKVIDKFVEVVGRPSYIYPQQEGEEYNRVFSYGAFILPPKNKVEEYHAPNGSGPDGPYGDTEYNWYNWNVANWGVKWDAGNVDMNDITSELQASKGTKALYLAWDSPWSIPEPGLAKMIEKWPKLTFDGRSEEEQGWGARWYGEDGQMSINYWDIPVSHAEYADRDTIDNPDGCICSHYDDPNEWFGDCPDREEAIAEYEKENANV